jgi:hypothetical protein
MFPSLASARSGPGNLLHGTVVVVVSTKEGFVLGSDSRLTNLQTGQPAPYGGEKVFLMGDRAAIAIAGLVSSSLALQPSIAESLAGDFRLHNKLMKADGNPWEQQATGPLGWFLSRFDSLLQLIDTGVELDSRLAAASAVSVSNDGVPEWITVYLHAWKRYDQTGTQRWDYRRDFKDPPASRVVVMAPPEYEDFVNQILDRNPRPGDPVLQIEALRHYFTLKRTGQLSNLTIDDGMALAEFLIRAAISRAARNHFLGIGGDIQLLEVTRDGSAWIHRLDPAKLHPRSISPVYAWGFPTS